MSKEIQLSNRGIALVDDADYHWLSIYTWSKSNVGYVQGWIDGHHILMHRLLTGAQKGQEVDHKNGIKHDNQRHNLRIVTRLENMQNITTVAKRKAVSTAWQRRRRNATGYFGVFFNGKCYDARISKSGKRYYLGRRASAEEAAQLYDAMARELYGERAILNFPI